MRKWGLVVIIIILSAMLAGCVMDNEYDTEAKAEPMSKAIKDDYQEGIKLIGEGDWDNASMMLAIPKCKEYKDSPVLYAYVHVEKQLIEGDFNMLMCYLEDIPDDYQGDLAEIVLQRKQDIVDNKEKLKEEMKEQTEIKAREREEETKEIIRANALLENNGFKWYQSSRSHVRAEGEVKNISDEPLHNVMAVITYETQEGEFITYDHALIEYNPIMPDQTSPFSVISTYNPLMETARLEFRYLSGEKILCCYE